MGSGGGWSVRECGGDGGGEVGDGEGGGDSVCKEVVGVDVVKDGDVLEESGVGGLMIGIQVEVAAEVSWVGLGIVGG